ncbi:MAG: neutral/alkaline non-lysosomal ceramidase N-terminal domain-containing protein [Thermogutta sp.]
MSRMTVWELSRRRFLELGGALGWSLAALKTSSGEQDLVLQVGEGVADITPPTGIELGGFHRPPGQERRVRGIRQPTCVRALAFHTAQSQVIICSLELLAFDDTFARRVAQKIAEKTGVPAQHVRLAATHTHSMPGFCFMRQWGAIPEDFMHVVEERTVEAACQAVADLSPAELLIGTSLAVGGSHNRTTKTFKTEDQFDASATDDDRWLDRTIHVLLFPRKGKRTLCWYHFSAHAVCYADEMAGPDWPGEVAARLRDEEKLDPGFLQGHCGDVNPGDGSDWRGEIKQTVSAIYPALKKALANVSPVRYLPLRSLRANIGLPYDIDLFQSWLQTYRESPEKCNSGEWVDAGFAEDWYRGNVNRKLSEKELSVPISALCLGDVAMIFHPAELYSCYGLTMRRDSPFVNTIPVGYSDGFIGYLPDPKAYQTREYAAMVVPKILDYPPFQPVAGRVMTARALELLKRLA